MNFIKQLASGALRSLGYTIQRADLPGPTHFLLTDELYAPTIRRVETFTMTSYERIATLIEATRHVARHKIPGAIVECGVWRGGSMMAAAITLLEEGEVRDLYLFDTYAGMTEPGEADIDHEGLPAKQIYDRSPVGEDHIDWCYASVEDVRQNLLSTGYPEDRVHIVKGDVLQTIPHPDLKEIALLRLDTDWYDSTLHELQHLYPLLRDGGPLIIDDYGYWQGCRRAVEEYFGRLGPFLSIIDQTGRLAIKPAATDEPATTG